MKLNTPIDLKYSTRYYQFIRQYAIREIVTESVCRKALSLESKARSWEFKFADYKDDNQIADTVFFQLQKRISNFATIAHTIMVEI